MHIANLGEAKAHLSELIERAAADKNMQYQQNFRGRKIAVVMLSAP